MGPGSEVVERDMWEVLCNQGVEYKWTKCELLHEFLEKYQVKYRNPFTNQDEECLVLREQVREAVNGRFNS